MKQFSSLVIKTLLGLLIAASAVGSAAATLTPTERQLVEMACHHNVVMLGENSHGDGATIAIRAKLVPQLVRRCGFSAIAFEASLYDFTELANTTASGAHYDRGRFLSAVGLLWARDAEFAPLANWVAKQTPKTLRLGGMDVQVGAAGAFYSLKQMPAELANVIPQADRATCRETMISFINWTVDRASFEGRVDRCLSLALQRLQGQRTTAAAKLRRLARAFRTTATWANMKPDEMIAARDAAMAEQLKAFRRELKPGTKIIVWTANAHAALGGYPVGKPLGDIIRQQIGSGLLSVAFSAAAGDFRWSKSETHPVPVATVASLERTVLNGNRAALADRTQLKRIGTVSGTALDWHKPMITDWSTLFDAIYVIDRERPTTILDSQ